MPGVLVFERGFERGAVFRVFRGQTLRTTAQDVHDVGNVLGLFPGDLHGVRHVLEFGFSSELNFKLGGGFSPLIDQGHHIGGDMHGLDTFQ